MKCISLGEVGGNILIFRLQGVRPLIFLFFFFLSFVFFGLHLWHVEVPRLGGPIRATAAGLCHNHSNARSKLRLRPTPQLTATPDPYPTERSQGSNPQPPGSQLNLFPLHQDGTSPPPIFRVSFLAYIVMISYLYILQNDHNKSS